MPRVKVPRKSTAIDMTAMCDVAFLLLTFFILSAKPKTQDPVHAEVPASTAIIPLPENDFSTILIAQGKTFFSVEGAEIRMETLKGMSAYYKIPFSAQDLKLFAATETVGVPIAQLHQFLNLSNQEKGQFQQPGVPVDTTANNELYQWVMEARKADKLVHDKELRIAIKGDSQEEYPVIAKVIATLQKQKVNKFGLITSLKTVTK